MNHIIYNYQGFGDNIFHIPFVHELAKQGEVYCHTPFPELFQGMERVYCKPLTTALKLQVENSTNNPLYDREHHANGKQIQLDYHQGMKQGLSIMESFERTIPLTGEFFYTFPFKKYKRVDNLIRKIGKKKKICVMRLPSVRKEWANEARNGSMAHFQTCIDFLKDKYYLIAVGDIGNREEYCGAMPMGIHEHRDHRHIEGHLGIWEVVDLINRADLTVSIQCNILPICQSLRKKSFFIYGGYHSHRLVNDPRMYQVGCVEPDDICNCLDRNHKCHKHIDKDKLINALEETINASC